MTSSEYRIEHRHEYLLALALMGLAPQDTPSADQHNAAVERADAHIAALKAQERGEAITPLLALRDSL